MDALSYAPVGEGQVKCTRWKRSLLLWHKGVPQQWAGALYAALRCCSPHLPAVAVSPPARLQAA